MLRRGFLGLMMGGAAAFAAGNASAQSKPVHLCIASAFEQATEMMLAANLRHRGNSNGRGT